MGYRSSPEGGSGIGVSTDHVDAYHADRLDIPDAELLFRGHFARSGPDLVLTGQAAIVLSSPAISPRRNIPIWSRPTARI